MTNNIAKIRAALELLEWRVLESERKNQPIVAIRRQLDEALAALAELECALPSALKEKLASAEARIAELEKSAAKPSPGMFTAEEVKEAYREGYSDWQHGRRILEADWRISVSFKLIQERTP